MRYVHLPAAAVDTALLEDATRRGMLTALDHIIHIHDTWWSADGRMGGQRRRMRRSRSDRWGREVGECGSGESAEVGKLGVG